jgi:hypothetical protein
MIKSDSDIASHYYMKLYINHAAEDWITYLSIYPTILLIPILVDHRNNSRGVEKRHDFTERLLVNKEKYAQR